MTRKARITGEVLEALSSSRTDPKGLLAHPAASRIPRNIGDYESRRGRNLLQQCPGMKPANVPRNQKAIQVRGQLLVEASKCRQLGGSRTPLDPAAMPGGRRLLRVLDEDRRKHQPMTVFHCLPSYSTMFLAPTDHNSPSAALRQ